MALNYYNNSTSRAKQLQYLQRFEYFVELSQSGKIEMLRQIILGILGQQCAHYDGAGKFTSGMVTDAEAFSQQGVDINCNEYYIYYPNIIIIYSLSRQLEVLKNIGLEQQSADNVFDDMAQNESKATENFNQYLIAQQFMAQIVDNQGEAMDPRQVERFYEAMSESQKSRVHLYGFNTQPVQEPIADDPNDMSQYKTGPLDISSEALDEYYEQMQFGIDRLLQVLQTEKLETIQKYIDDPDKLFKYTKLNKKFKDIDGLYEDQEELEEDEIAQEKPKHLNHEQINQIKQLLNDQKERYKKFLASNQPECQLPSEDRLSLAIKLQQTETPLQLIAATNMVRFQQISTTLKQDMVHTHIICIQNKENLWKILDQVQFLTLKYLRAVLLGQKPFQLQNKQIQITSKTFQTFRDLIVMQTDHCYAILHGITSNMAQYQQQQFESLETYKIENIKIFNDFSEQKNNFLVNFCEIGERSAVVAFRRQKIPEAGNPQRLHEFPIYLRSRNGFPKADELSFLKIDLGYEKPIIETVEPQIESESESSSSSVQPRRRRGNEYTDEYDSYDYDYSLITSDEQMSPISSSTTEPEEEDSATPEPVYIEKIIFRKDFNFDTMEAIDANGNPIIQPHRPIEPEKQEGGEHIKDELDNIFAINDHQNNSFEHSDPERKLMVRIWREPELLEKERRRRERAFKRAQAIKNKKNKSGRPRQHRGPRGKAIIINSENATQFKQFKDVLELQKLQTEALKRIAMEQMQGRRPVAASRNNPRMSVAKIITPQQQQGRTSSSGQYFGETNSNIHYSGFQGDITKSMVDSKGPVFTASSLATSGGFGTFSQCTQFNQSSRRPDIRMVDLKKKVREYQVRTDLDDNLKGLIKVLDQIIRTQEAKQQKGRLPLSFYDEIKQKMKDHGYTVEDFMK